MMKKINEAFLCGGCGKTVPTASKTCRNHCLWCFFSLHVDEELPGDRGSKCHGAMIPTMYKRANGTIKILFRCQTCGKEHWNKASDDDHLGDLDASIEHWKLHYATI